MRVVIASAFEAGSLKAHAINTVKMAEGFAKLGHEAHLICMAPHKNRLSTQELIGCYGLQETVNLHWHQLPPQLLGFKITPHWPFALLSLPLVFQLKPDFLYSRNYILPATASRFGIPTAGETHAWPDNSVPAFQTFIKATRYPAFRGCITIAQHLADAYAELGMEKSKIQVLPDSVDLSLFRRPSPLPDQSSPYNASGPHVTYTGHLYDYKGIPTILEAATMLPEVNFHLVGGLPQDIKRHSQTITKQNLHNVTLHGLLPHSQVPPYLWHADVLLLPPSAHHPSANWTSPVKLGEYLASGTPIVATSIPALRTWLTDEEVLFIPPDDAQALANAIQQLVAEPALGQQLSKVAVQKAASITYENRAQAILSACGLSATAMH